MKINIGNNNNINKSTIGNNNKFEKEKSNFKKIILNLLITVFGGLIIGYLVYMFGWNS